MYWRKYENPPSRRMKSRISRAICWENAYREADAAVRVLFLHRGRSRLNMYRNGDKCCGYEFIPSLGERGYSQKIYGPSPNKVICSCDITSHCSFQIKIYKMDLWNCVQVFWLITYEQMMLKQMRVFERLLKSWNFRNSILKSHKDITWNGKENLQFHSCT